MSYVDRERTGVLWRILALLILGVGIASLAIYLAAGAKPAGTIAYTVVSAHLNVRNRPNVKNSVVLGAIPAGYQFQGRAASNAGDWIEITDGKFAGAFVWMAGTGPANNPMPDRAPNPSGAATRSLPTGKSTDDALAGQDRYDADARYGTVELSCDHPAFRFGPAPLYMCFPDLARGGHITIKSGNDMMLDWRYTEILANQDKPIVVSVDLRHYQVFIRTDEPSYARGILHYVLRGEQGEQLKAIDNRFVISDSCC